MPGVTTRGSLFGRIYMQLMSWVSYTPTFVVLTYKRIVSNTSTRSLALDKAQPRPWGGAEGVGQILQSWEPSGKSVCPCCSVRAAHVGCPCWCSTRLDREAFGCRDWKSSRRRLCHPTVCFIGCSLALTPAKVFFPWCIFRNCPWFHRLKLGYHQAISLNSARKDKPDWDKVKFEHQRTIVLNPEMERQIWYDVYLVYLNCSCTSIIHYSIVVHRAYWDDESTDLELDFPSTAGKVRRGFLLCEPMFKLTGFSTSLFLGEIWDWVGQSSSIETDSLSLPMHVTVKSQFNSRTLARPLLLCIFQHLGLCRMTTAVP